MLPNDLGKYESTEESVTSVVITGLYQVCPFCDVFGGFCKATAVVVSAYNKDGSDIKSFIEIRCLRSISPLTSPTHR